MPTQASANPECGTLTQLKTAREGGTHHKAHSLLCHSITKQTPDMERTKQLVSTETQYGQAIETFHKLATYR